MSHFSKDDLFWLCFSIALINYQNIIVSNLVLMKWINHLPCSHTEIFNLGVAVVWLGQLFPDLSPQRPRFDSKPVCVGFVVHRVVLGQVGFLWVLSFSPVIIILALLRIHTVFIFHQHYIIVEFDSFHK